MLVNRQIIHACGHRGLVSQQRHPKVRVSCTLEVGAGIMRGTVTVTIALHITVELSLRAVAAARTHWHCKSLKRLETLGASVDGIYARVWAGGCSVSTMPVNGCKLIPAANTDGKALTMQMRNDKQWQQHKKC